MLLKLSYRNLNGLRILRDTQKEQNVNVSKMNHRMNFGALKSVSALVYDLWNGFLSINLSLDKHRNFFKVGYHHLSVLCICFLAIQKHFTNTTCF